MRFLRTNTACRVTVGPFFDKTDGVTPETAITVTSCKLTLMVDDANVPTLVLDTAPTASGGSNDMVHVTGDDAGFYDLELAAANVNYLGRAMLAITDAATHCPVFHEFMILPAMIYDSMVLGTDRLDTNVTHVADTSQTARDIGASVLLSSGTGTGQVTLTSGRVNADLTHIAAAAVSTTTAQLGVNVVQLSGDATAADNAEAFFDGTGYAGTNNVIPLVTSVTGNVGGSVASVVGAVGSVTGNVGGNVTGSVGSVTGLTAGNLDATISSRLASESYTAPPSAATISAQVASDLNTAHGSGSWVAVSGFATAIELAKVIKTGEAVTHVRSGKTDVIETVTRN